MPADTPNSILADTATYYAEKIAAFGATPRGVDWNGEDGQRLRFTQLAKIIDANAETINDLGCGYGAFLDYLNANHPGIDYHGVDIAPPMIEAARRTHPLAANAFSVGDHPSRIADYTIASGIFNVRRDHSDAAWLDYILSTLHLMNAASHRGFAFNCLTAYSDPERMRPDLYYAQPDTLFDYCMRHFSRNVALLHDYRLYEFTIIVRKD